MLKLTYDYGSATENNGSLKSQTMIVPNVGANQGFTAVQNYSYDSLNRLQSATETVSGTQTWKQTFQYDRYGNRRFDAANTTTLGSCPQTVCNPLINTSDNRFSLGQGYGYDKTGNVTLDAGNQRFVYDAENHQKEFFKGTNNTTTPDATYLYDGEGKRVKKISYQETTVFVYDGGGQLAAEYSTQTVQTPQTSYLTADHLGSPRIITNQLGAVTSRKDFVAFGDETLTAQRTSALGYQPDEIRQDYTGYQKDDESGLEFAQARYYNTTHGRFTSVDPLTASANIRNPQTFNRYSYVLNSPYKFTDPLGLLPVSIACGQWCPGSGGYVDGSAFRGRDTSFDWAREYFGEVVGYGIAEPQQPEPPRQITLTGGNKEQRDAIQASIDTLKAQSPFFAGTSFSTFEGSDHGQTLTIEILDDASFVVVAKDIPTALGLTSENGGRNYVDPKSAPNVIIYIKASAINIKQENTDRKANRETQLEGILGHELGHAVDLVRDYMAYTQRSTEDKPPKDYHDRRNERFADYALKSISLERNITSGVKEFKQNLRFPKTLSR